MIRQLRALRHDPALDHVDLQNSLVGDLAAVLLVLVAYFITGLMSFLLSGDSADSGRNAVIHIAFLTLALDDLGICVGCA